MNISRPFGDIIYHLQECVSCANKNTMQCNVCAFKGQKLNYKYFEKYE